MAAPLLSVTDLAVEFSTDEGKLRAVDGISYSLNPGETLGIVGESGSGKSVSSLAILGLVPYPPGRVTSGAARFDGVDLLKLRPREMSRIRGRRISMIFQDPMTALNPFLTVERQLTEVTQRHLGLSRQRAQRYAIEMLERVGIPSAGRRIFDYPHQFSGGMRQRVMIAMALSCKPQILFADEPTTALDVTIQAQILELLGELQRAEGTAIVLITHDLGVVAGVCQRVNVMYAGRFVEEANVDDLFARPRHPYTVGLLHSIPRLDRAGEALTPIPGQPPNLAALPSGCAFRDRCLRASEMCGQAVPPLTADGKSTRDGVKGGQRFACFHPHPVPEPAGAPTP